MALWEVSANSTVYRKNTFSNVVWKTVSKKTYHTTTERKLSSRFYWATGYLAI